MLCTLNVFFFDTKYNLVWKVDKLGKVLMMTMELSEQSSSCVSICQLAEAVGMPAEAIGKLRSAWDEGLGTRLNEHNAAGLIRELSVGERAESAWRELETLLRAGNDEGWKILAAMLDAGAGPTLARYRAEGIGEDVFIATMGAFSRFVEESKVRYGSYRFDRAFWTWRQTSLRIFRLGALEYETTKGMETPACILEAGGLTEPVRAVSVHIPSDADLSPAAVDASLSAWHEFAMRHRRQWADASLWCESWLLAPALERLLPPNSRILAFQRRFSIVQVHADAPDWREWIFDCNPSPIAELPEDTALRRTAKRYLLGGGSIGVGVGVLRTARR